MRTLMYRILIIMSFFSFWLVYMMVHVLDLAILLSYIIFATEISWNIFIILLTYIFGVIRASLPYIFLYFGLCLFNLHYEGYYKLKFFGIILDNYQKKKKLNKWVWHFKEYSYFYLILFHFLFLLFIIYFELFESIYFLIFFLIFYFLIWLNIKIKYYIENKSNLKDQYFNWFINLTLITLLGFYINVLFEGLTPYLNFKLNLYETISNLLEDRLILKMSQNNKSWFRLYILDKEYWSKNVVWLLKTKILNIKFLYNYKNLYTKYLVFNKNYNRFFINMLNFKDERAYQQKFYDKTALNEINNFNNIIYLSSLKPSETQLYYINNNNNIDVQHDFDNYLNRKLIILDRTGLNIEHFQPTQEPTENLKFLITNQKNDLNLLNLLLNKKDIQFYNDYIKLHNKIINNYFCIFDILIKKK